MPSLRSHMHRRDADGGSDEPACGIGIKRLQCCLSTYHLYSKATRIHEKPFNVARLST
jgi:hypothetical protein